MEEGRGQEMRIGKWSLPKGSGMVFQLIEMELFGEQIVISGVVLLCGGRLIREGEPSLRIEKPWETIELCKRVPLEET